MRYALVCLNQIYFEMISCIQIHSSPPDTKKLILQLLLLFRHSSSHLRQSNGSYPFNQITPAGVIFGSGPFPVRNDFANALHAPYS